MALLEIKDLTKDFGGLRALDKVSFYVNEGEIVGLIGPNGAGKTTLFNLITGFYSITGGNIVSQGKDITGFRPDEVARMGIVRTFQATTLLAEMSVLTNVILGCHLHTKIGFWGALLNTKYTRKREGELRIQAMDILDFLGIAEMSSELAGNLSHGHQRVLQIAVALAANPVLVLLDEAFSGMSSVETNLMMGHIEAVRNRGATILLVEHNMKVVIGLCNRIVVLDHGMKLVEGIPQEVTQDKRVIEAYLGTEEEDENFD